MVYSFSPKQVALLDAVNSLVKAAEACNMDPATRTIVITSMDSIKGALIAEIGRAIVIAELNKDPHG